MAKENVYKSPKNAEISTKTLKIVEETSKIAERPFSTIWGEKQNCFFFLKLILLIMLMNKTLL